MSKRIGKYTVEMTKPVLIKEYASVVGKMEGEGPLRALFDHINGDNEFAQTSWEQSEGQLQLMAASKAVNKASLTTADIDFIIAGDLQNQCAGSHYGLRSMNIPFLGVFGACSTMSESMALSAMLIDGGSANRCLAVTSSHFCTAERQFRMPLDYGSQRPQTAQWTVTGAGALILENREVSGGIGPYITSATIGSITSFGIKDANNMGAAMAPAAAETIKKHLEDTKTKPGDYDKIYTGDLGAVGKDMLIMLLKRENIDISAVHDDCGLMIYDRESQDVHAGGSGCGCSAAVLCSKILNDMRSKQYNKILFTATGALMNSTILLQGQDIPCIAHTVSIRT